MRIAARLCLSLGVSIALAGSLPAQPPGRPGPPAQAGPGGMPLMRLLDTNRDGTLSQDELAQAGEQLKQLDANQDGQLAGEELRGLLPGGPDRGMPGPGGTMGGRRGGRGPGGPGDGNVADDEFIKPVVPRNDTEEKILAALRTMQEGPRYANVSSYDGRLLRLLAEATNAQTVVEIGTSTGESAVWFALALRGTGGHLYTHEIDEGRAKIAAENFQKAGVEDQITLVMGDAHETVKRYKDPIDILFLDADKEGYLDYLQKLVPLLRPGGLIIAHNMNARQADPQFLKEITTNPDFETLFLIREGTGVGVTLKKR